MRERKTTSSDAASPAPIGLNDVKSVNLSAEHARVELSEPNTRLRVSDKLEFALGYSDTTVCLPRRRARGRSRGRVEIVWPILGRGKLR